MDNTHGNHAILNPPLRTWNLFVDMVSEIHKGSKEIADGIIVANPCVVILLSSIEFCGGAGVLIRVFECLEKHSSRAFGMAKDILLDGCTEGEPNSPSGVAIANLP